MIQGATSRALATNARVTLEVPLDDPRSLLKDVPTAADDTWIEDSHLTVLHLGKLSSLFDEVYEATGVSREAFVEACAQMFEAWLSGPQDLSARVLGVDVFEGHEEWFTALSLEPDAALKKLRDDSRSSLLFALGAMGIDDAETFLATSPTVGQFSPEWNPHVTLSRSSEYEEPTPLNTPIDLRLARPQIRPRRLFESSD